jgi:hypothetical protein
MINGATPVRIAAEEGFLDMMRWLGKEFSADIQRRMPCGNTPLHLAAQFGQLAIVTCLVTEFDADVNEARKDGATPLIVAANEGNLDMVRCLVKKLGADVNKAMHNGTTPLMAATQNVDSLARISIIKSLVHQGAVVGAESAVGGTALTMLAAAVGASAAEIAYLKVRECCTNPGCKGGGRKRCAVCKETRYCGMACRTTHWRAHRVSCWAPDGVSTLDQL